MPLIYPKITKESLINESYRQLIPIISTVCKICNKTLSDLKNTNPNSRRREFATPRHTAMYFIIKRKLMIPLRVIAETFNQVSHCTVLSGVETIQNRVDTEKEFKAQIAQIENEINRRV